MDVDEYSDHFELAARRVLTRLLESQGIQFVSSRGVSALAGLVSQYLYDHREDPERATRFADWLMDQVEVAELFVDDQQLETILAEEWDGRHRVQATPEISDRNPRLEAELLKSPERTEHYLVYSDWLQARGDLYGELIARQVAAHLPGAAKAAVRRAYAFLDAHEHELLGPLAEYLRKVIHLEWHMGFVRGARIGRTPSDTESYQGQIMLRWLLEHRASLLLRSLELESCERRPSGQTQAMVEVLGTRPPAGLQRLKITGRHDKVVLGNMLDALPQLRELSLATGRLGFEPMQLPHLSTLELALSRVGGGVEALAASDLPKLESLALYGYVPCDTPEAAPLYERPFPQLRRLRARGYDQLIERLAGSALLAQLEVLDLSGGGLRDEVIHDILIPRARRFVHLRQLIVDDNALTATAIAALHRCLGATRVRANDQHPDPYEYDDDEYDDDDGYYEDGME